ncbi:MAG TPA: lytic murein transglycosylase, partial [Paraburkholderia sp.]|nr:lytic murein transglycosylase [Paraburkholderia sp.]
MQRAQLLLLALTATLAACASNTPATSVIVGDASHTVVSPVEQTAPTAQISSPAPPGMPGPAPVQA